MIQKTLLITFALFFGFFMSSETFAQGGTFKIAQPGGIKVDFTGNPNTNPYAEGIVQTILLNIINLFFTVGGIGVLIFFLWGAVDWIFSGGDKEKVAGARKKMTNAIIGLVLLALSFAIIRTVGAIAGFDRLGNLQIGGLGKQFQ
jgi:hypothetical protein